MANGQNLEHLWYYTLETLGILLLSALQYALLIH